jgi:hypothetical protein
MISGSIIPYWIGSKDSTFSKENASVVPCWIGSKDSTLSNENASVDSLAIADTGVF